MNTSFYKEMAVALPGQVADGSRYNVDGACVVDLKDNAPKEILCGLAVYVRGVGADGVKEIHTMEANQKPYGVAIRSHATTVTTPDGHMAYGNADGINVMTTGRVWMIAETDFAPAFGSQVKLGNDGKAKTDGALEPAGWTYAGGKTSFGGLHLLEVQLRQL